MATGSDPRGPLPIELSRARSLQRHRVAEVSEPPPGDHGWRYRTDGAPRWLALTGVVVGFLLLVFPGIVAMRSYRRWRQGIRLQPAFAWVVGVVGIWAAVVAAILLATDFLALAWLAALIGPLASTVIVLRS